MFFPFELNFNINNSIIHFRDPFKGNYYAYSNSKVTSAINTLASYPNWEYISNTNLTDPLGIILKRFRVYETQNNLFKYIYEYKKGNNFNYIVTNSTFTLWGYYSSSSIDLSSYENYFLNSIKDNLFSLKIFRDKIEKLIKNSFNKFLINNLEFAQQNKFKLFTPLKESSLYTYSPFLNLEVVFNLGTQKALIIQLINPSPARFYLFNSTKQLDIVLSSVRLRRYLQIEVGRLIKNLGDLGNNITCPNLIYSLWGKCSESLYYGNLLNIGNLN